MTKNIKQFEYKVYTPFLTGEDKLNELGAEGWELVAVDNGTFYLKREYKE
jgi:hypothetical protein